MTRTIVALGTVLAVSLGLAAWAATGFTTLPSPAEPPPVPAPASPPMTPPPATGFAADRDKPAASLPLDGERFQKYLKDLCDLGPRVSGSPGMAKQQSLLITHFEGLGATVTKQSFTGTQRSKPQGVAMRNLVASFHPGRAKRVILCSHYDTRPAAHEERDPRSWQKPFVSANDGTAGVALMMELAHHLKDLPAHVGVDLVMFDGEEYIFDMGVPGLREGDSYFLGSKHFAAEYAKARLKLPYKYTAAILLDLCCAANARLAVEGYSWQFAPQLVQEVWDIADKRGAKSFKYEQGFTRAMQVQDDHIALNEVGIPAVDIIDFDYPHWHLLSDTPDKVSTAQSLEVGQVLLAWVQKQAK